MHFSTLSFGIARKLIAIALVPIALMIIMATIALQDLSIASNQFAREIKLYSPLMVTAQSMMRDFYRSRGALSSASLSAVDGQTAFVSRDLQQYHIYDQSLAKQLRQANAMGLPAVDGVRLAHELNIYDAYAKQVIAMLQKHQSLTSIHLLLKPSSDSTLRIANDLMQLYQKYSKLYDATDERLSTHVNNLSNTIFLIIAATVILSFLSTLVFSRRIVNRIKRLIFSLQRLAAGERDFSQINDPVRDEIGDALQALKETASTLYMTEQNVFEQLQFRQSLLDAIPVPIYFKDLDGRYVETNHAFERFQGSTTLIGKTAFDVLPEDLAKQHLAMDAIVLQEPGIHSFEGTTIDANAKRHDMLFYKTTLSQQNGEITGIIGVMMDITQAKESQGQIEHMGQLYKALAQTNQAIVHMRDEVSLFNELCRIAVVFGGMKMAWVGRFGDNEDWLLPLAIHSDRQIESMIRTFEGVPREKDRLATIPIIERHPVIVQSYEDDTRFASWWKDDLIAAGFVSAASFPIFRGDTVYASFTVFHDLKNIFDHAMIALFSEMAMDIGFALEQIDIEQSRLLAEKELYLSSQVLSQSREGILIADIQGNIVSTNLAFTAITGFTTEDLRDTPFGQEKVRYYYQLYTKFAKRGHWQDEIWETTKDNQRMLILLSISQVVDDNGDISHFVATLSDITRRQLAEDALLEAEMRWRETVDFLPDPTFAIDATGRVIAWNQAIELLTGIKAIDMIGKDNHEYALPFYGVREPIMIDLALKHDDQFIKRFSNVVRQGDRLAGDSIVTHLPEGEKYLAASALVLRDAMGDPIAVIETLRDMTAYRVAQDKIEQLAHYDDLTGLPNRVLLQRQIAHQIAIADYSKQSFAILFLDLDHFKVINDTLGHKMGDLLLVEVAERLRSIITVQDTVARLGGDEFILVLPNRNDQEITQVSEALLPLLEEPFFIEGYELITTPSIGIAVYPRDGQDWDTLYRHADIAMYRAKTEGRKGYFFFTPEMQVLSERRLILESALRKAIEKDELVLYFQPIVSLATNKAVGVEALLRWHHSAFGIISPGEFIPIAEDSGLIVPIGEWVLRSAVKQMKTWREEGIILSVMAINISMLQLIQHNFPELALSIMKEIGIHPNLIEFEITESVAMQDPERAIAVMKTLHDQGIRIAIDDFGTGYSSLAYLNRFPIDKLKIDQSFVRDIGVDASDEAIVKTIIQMAQNLNLNTVAEGVESDQEAVFLQAHGCEEVQGYYYSRPKPAHELVDWLRGHTY